MIRLFRRGLGSGHGAWPLLVLLVLALAVPSAAVLWFMNAAIRENLAEAQREQLSLVRDSAIRDFEKRLARMDEIARTYPAPEAFHKAVEERLAASAVLAGYPAPLRMTEPSSAALGKEARIRALLRNGDKPAVIRAVTESFADRSLDRATDSTGRVIAASADLLALQLLGKPDIVIAPRLKARVLDYTNPAMGSDQRRFLMREMAPLGIESEMLAAEDLAARWIEGSRGKLAGDLLAPAGIDGVWQIRTPEGRMTALLTLAVLPAGLIPPGAAPDSNAIVTDASPRMPAWRIAWKRPAAARGESAFYVWTAVLAITSIAALVLLTGWLILRQMKIARLKNDLVATVTHELRTPVASTRLLVDTLLDAKQDDPVRTREYLELIARENNRLSRLIDNFLAFSRMERNRTSFDFRAVTPDEIVRGAEEASADRLRAEGCDFRIRIGEGLPPLHADPDALVTVLVNLLDNAYKYSDAPRRIELEAFRDSAGVVFAVKDNGIGMSDVERKRVFERFYQADQRLTRRAGGCGLGLSIVDFIVRAHRGRVAIESAPGQGTRFSVSIPLERPV